MTVDEPSAPCLIHEAITAEIRWQSLPVEDVKGPIPEWLEDELRRMRAEGAVLRAVLKRGQKIYPALTRPMLDAILGRTPRKRRQPLSESQWNIFYFMHYLEGVSFAKLSSYAQTYMGVHIPKDQIHRMLQKMHRHRTGEDHGIS